jgi:hypothetical protein
VRFVLDKITLGQVFLQVLQFSLQYHSINSQYSSSSTCHTYQTDKRTKPGNLPKRNALSEIGVALVTKLLPLFVHMQLSSSGGGQLLNQIPEEPVIDQLPIRTAVFPITESSSGIYCCTDRNGNPLISMY